MLQFRRESTLEDSVSAVGKSRERSDTLGHIKQTTSGRIELQVTKNFSVIIDEVMLGEMQRLQGLAGDATATDRYISAV